MYFHFPAECRAVERDVWLQTEGGPTGSGQTEPAEEQAFGQDSGHTGSGSGQLHTMVTGLGVIWSGERPI